MRIISRFKDYYDYIAHQYGGGDPKVVYVRDEDITPISRPTVKLQTEVSPPRMICPPVYWNGPPVKILTNVYPPPIPYSRTLELPTKMIIIAGKVFSLVGERQSYETIPHKFLGKIYKYPIEWNLLVEMPTPKQHWFNKKSVGYGEHHPEIEDLCVKLKAPVFEVSKVTWCKDGWKNYYLEHKVPKLSDYGFPRVYPAEQIYQDIALHLGKQISVDVPVALTDKERIVQAGFDLKQSFRHRK